MSANARSGIVLVVDRLGAGYLGPYGNTWIETPHFNRLGAESMLFEFVLADSPRLPTLYRSYWTGAHAMAEAPGTGGVPDLLASTAIHTVLVTDDTEVSEMDGAECFDERILVGQEPVARAVQEPGQTQMARLFAAAVDWLEQAPQPFLLWIHSRGMAGPWDAPSEFRNRFADEDDPLPPAEVEPPVRRLQTGYDPDEVLGWQHAYAGQITVLDLCLGVLLDAVKSSAGRDDTLLMVTSPRGYPLGEHGRIGTRDELLYGELLHVPWFVRFPGGAAATVRCPQLVQPPDMFASVLDWLGMEMEGTGTWGTSVLRAADGELGAVRDRAAACADGCRALRTPAWFLLRHPDSRRELFAKPDDRWEANEVADRCQETVEELDRLLDEFQHAVQAADPARLTPLSETLLRGLD